MVFFSVLLLNYNVDNKPLTKNLSDLSNLPPRTLLEICLRETLTLFTDHAAPMRLRWSHTTTVHPSLAAHDGLRALSW